MSLSTPSAACCAAIGAAESAAGTTRGTLRETAAGICLPMSSQKPPVNIPTTLISYSPCEKEINVSTY